MNFGSTQKKVLRIVLGAALGLFLAWLTYRKTNWAGAEQAFKRAHLSFLGLALCCLAADYVLRVWRWWQMLKSVSPDVRWRSCFPPFLGSIALNNLLPLRSGDLVRAFGFAKKLGTPAAAVLGTLIVERLLDMLGLVFYFLVALSGAGSIGLPVAFLRGVVIVGALGFLLLLGAIAFPDLILGSPALARWTGSRPKIKEAIHHLVTTLAMMRNPRLSARLVGCTLVIWGLEGGVFGFTASALGAPIGVSASLLALSIGTLSTLLPGSPGYVGTFDFFTGLAVKSAIPEVTLRNAYVLGIHLMLWFPLTLVGVGALVLSQGRAGLSEARHQKQAVEVGN